jgi:hypothetical protein
MSLVVGTGEEPPVDNYLPSSSRNHLVSFPSCNNVSLVIACLMIDGLFFLCLCMLV